MSNERTKSGHKFQTPQGFSAIKDGIKPSPVTPEAEENLASARKPPWLRVKIAGGKRDEQVKTTVRDHRLATVCEESHCPNVGECWNNGWLQ